MCFEKKDAAFAAVCKERDELRVICEKQARMNRSMAKMALDLDTMTADRDRLQRAYDAMAQDLEFTNNRLTDALNELARLRALQNPADNMVEVVRCADCKHDCTTLCPLAYIEKQTLQFVNHDADFFCAKCEWKEDYDG